MFNYIKLRQWFIALIAVNLICSVCALTFNRYIKDFPLQENDACGKGGVCKIDTDCPALENLNLKTQKLPFCGFRDRSSIVCCPQDVSPKSGPRISQRMCTEYTEQIFPRFVSFGFNGEQAKPKELPFSALVGYGVNISEVSWKCSGSIVSTNFVISAAHCSETPNGDPASWVRLGDLDFATDTDVADPNDYSIAERINHPNYSKKGLWHDIALYRIEGTIKFGDFIRPICLSDAPAKIDEPVFAAGWGLTESAGPRNSKLIIVSLNVLKEDHCSGVIDKTVLPNGLLDGMICAGNLVTKADTCPGDSGGPLYLPLPSSTDRQLPMQIGLTSFGHKICDAGHPGVYTRISEYLNWIEKVVWMSDS